MDAETAAIAAAWPLYYEREAFSAGDKRLVLVRGFAEWFRTDGAPLLREVAWAAQGVVAFHYDDFKARCPYPDFVGALREEPDDLLRCLGLALCVLRSEVVAAGAPPIKITPRMLAVNPLLPLRELKSGTVGKFVSVRGNVVRVSAVRPLVLRMNFTCTKCGSEVPAWFADGKYEPPSSCADATCRGRSFAPDYATAVTVDWQKIRLQELEADVTDAGRVPRTVEVELSEELVDAVVPGDVVTVGGVVKAIETDVAAGRGNARGKSLFLLYIDACSVAAHKVADRAGGGGGGAGGAVAATTAAAAAAAAAAPGAGGATRAFSERDLQFIARVRAHRDPFSLLVASAVPNIFGHELVKAGMLMALFGGTPHTPPPGGVAPPSAAAGSSADVDGDGSGDTAGARHSRGLGAAPSAGGGGGGSSGGGGGGGAGEGFDRGGGVAKAHIRSDPHVLVVGDPGMGKSQMLQAMSGLAPRGVYVCGNTTSTSGLTVTLVRDAVTGDMALEAGALVLGDQGLTCIDEFDKMAAEHQALLEAMEQQRISIAKAGIVSSLPARTSVLAAANPVGGHYNRGKTITENLRMSEALLSRFDLIFILLDRPDQVRDRQLGEHVLSLHDGGGGGGGGGAAGRGGGGASGGGGGGASQMALLLPGVGVGGGGGGTAPYGYGSDELEVDARRGVAGGMAATQAAHERARRYAGEVEARSAPSSSAASATAAPTIAPTARAPRLPLDVRLRRGVVAIPPAEIVPPTLLRKYVAYARRYCYPALLPDAAAVLQAYFLALRRGSGGGSSGSSGDSTPITTRQLESLIRLAQARAKVELREYVTREDAEDVVELMKEALYEAVADGGLGGVELGRVGGMSMAKQVKLFVTALNKAASNRGSALFSTDELERFSRDMRLQVPVFADFLDVLNQQSYLLKAGPRQWKLLSAGVGGR